MIKIRYLCTFFILMYLSVSFAQSTINNEIIIHLKNNNINRTIQELRRNNIIDGNLLINKIGESGNSSYWKLTFSNRIDNNILNYLIQSENIFNAQYNYKINYRNNPDDSLFTKQWSLNNSGQTGGQNNADIDANLAWDLTTGGLSPSGDTIVICVIDNGIDTSHVDIKNNLWKNHKEIRGNGIDDDQNGYVDDYLGWNTYLNNDNVSGGNHGTPVSGIIGAKGNNKIGISGINWNIKLMIVLNGNDEASIIGAYLYALRMRKLYNTSNGKKGAFVVATNSSFGIDNANAEDHPLWCSIYDSLGVQGILNIGATSNNNVNVDQVGDMPSSCPSDYLLTVTNMDKFNQKVNGAGYGKKTIDLGAYGKGTFSLRNQGNYGSFGGTSAATPHVTGVAGLVYSYDSILDGISHSHPSKASLMAKDAIISSVVHNNTLENITVSEGVLNAYNALKEIDKYNSFCPPPSIINIDSTGADLIKISWEQNNNISLYNIFFKEENSDWKYISTSEHQAILENLSFCTKYHFKIQSVCNDTILNTSYELSSKTIGCCDSPPIINSGIKGDSIHLKWGEVYAADDYTIQYKYWSDPLWQKFNSTHNQFNLDLENECGNYLFKINSNCTNIQSDTTSINIAKSNCEICEKNNYCQPEINNNFEWIEKVEIGDFRYQSGKDILGYGINNNAPAITIIKGENILFRVNISFSENTYNDHINAWIDFNRDSLFSPDELILSETNGNNHYIEKSVLLTNEFKTGITTLRIMLSDSSIEDPCDITPGDYGEYEDYCILLDTVSCDVDNIVIDTLNIDNSSVLINWTNPNNYKHFFLKIKNNDLSDIYLPVNFIKDTFYTINNLEKCTNYELLLSPYCTPYKSGIIKSLEFKTHCSDGINIIDSNYVEVFPNPFNNEIYINSDNTISEIELFDILGNKIYENKFFRSNKIKLTVKKITSEGIYFLKIRQKGTSKTYKIVKNKF